jgi:DNA-binding LytR/AlgR family response regulator
MSLRFAVVEDEPLARKRLKQLVQEVDPGAVCVAEAENGEAGLQLLQRHPLDVLFLDVEFPPDGAFGLLRRARAAERALPPIVFTTAFDRHAVEAFRWAACDYLLKPIKLDELREALGRLGQRPGTAALVAEVLSELEKRKVPRRFSVSTARGVRVFTWAEVSHIDTENRLLFVHTAEGRFCLDRTFAELESLLAPEFVRVHRSCMVNLGRVRALLTETQGGPAVLLEGNVRVAVSKDRMTALRDALSS